MAVLGTYTPIREAGNGSKVDFDFSFKVIEASDLSVGKILNSTEVKTDMVLGVDYTVTINPTTDGGTVTYMVAPTALQDSWIGRVVPATQAQDIPTNGLFRETQVENALDKITMVVQQQQEEIDRCVKLPDISSGITPVLPAPVDGLVPAWDGVAGAMENVDVQTLGAIVVDTDGTLAANSDSKVATQKATKTYADTKVPNSYLSTSETLAENSDSKVATQKATKTYVDASNKFFVYYGTRDMTAASGNVAYTGVGFRPKAIIAFTEKDNATLNFLSWGFATASLQGVANSVVATAGTTQQIGSIMAIYESSTQAQNANLVSFDEDGFTLGWTKSAASPSAGIAKFIYLAIG